MLRKRLPLTIVIAVLLAFGAGVAFGNPSGFPDTAAHWAEPAINRLAELGVIGGYADGTFQPDRGVTRAEVATMFNNFLSKTEVLERMERLEAGQATALQLDNDLLLRFTELRGTADDAGNFVVTTDAVLRNTGDADRTFDPSRLVLVEERDGALSIVAESEAVGAVSAAPGTEQRFGANFRLTRDQLFEADVEADQATTLQLAVLDDDGEPTPLKKVEIEVRCNWSEHRYEIIIRITF